MAFGEGSFCLCWDRFWHMSTLNVPLHGDDSNISKCPWELVMVLLPLENHSASSSSWTLTPSDLGWVVDCESSGVVGRGPVHWVPLPLWFWDRLISSDAEASRLPQAWRKERVSNKWKPNLILFSGFLCGSCSHSWLLIYGVFLEWWPPEIPLTSRGVEGWSLPPRKRTVSWAP